MDWLKDKKNQPIVAAIAAVVIVGACVLLWLTVFSGSSSQAPPTETASTEGMPTDGMPSPMQPGGGPPPTTQGTMPGAATGAPPQGAAPLQAVAQAPSTGPLETYRGDPFLPVGYKPPPTGPRPKPPITDLPILNLGPWPKPPDKKLWPEPAQPVRRLAGVMLNGRVYAIIESNGKSQIVQPGEPLQDGLATVERIEADKVILKTTSAAPRYLTVRLASSPRKPASEPAVAGPEGPPGPPPRGRPGSLRRG